MFGHPLPMERTVSGYHADNIAPVILGGFVLIKSMNPLGILKLDFPENRNLYFVLVSPEFEVPTKEMREVLPEEVKMCDHIWNSTKAGELRGNVKGLGEALSSDRIVEPKRAALIPGMVVVKEAAFGCTISGAGPTLVAIMDGEEEGKVIGEKMLEAFELAGKLKASAVVQRLDQVGARVVSISSVR